MRFFLTLALLLVITIDSKAAVNPKNGNFDVTYTDLAPFGGSVPLQIRRTYNSFASERGWFGNGWGSPLETRLFVLPDGSAVVKENGNGRRTFYRAASRSDETIDKGVQRIISAFSIKHKVPVETLTQLRRELVRDEELRTEYALAYGVETEMQIGASLGDICGPRSLVRLATSYKRSDCDRFGQNMVHTDVFDLSGRLLTRTYDGGYTLTVVYGNGSPVRIVDSNGIAIGFAWGERTLMLGVAGSGSHVKYEFDGQRNLSAVSYIGGDDDGLRYRFGYDASHNLTAIHYVDDTALSIAYKDRPQGIVASVTERIGTRVVYDYDVDPLNAQRHSTTVTTTSPSGEIKTDRFEYETQLRQDGAIAQTKLDRIGKYGQQRRVLDGDGRLTMTYDVDAGMTEYIYHPRSGKLLLALGPDSIKKYGYSEDGNLIEVRHAPGSTFRIAYHPNGSVKTIREYGANARLLESVQIWYDTTGRTVRIKSHHAGTINLAYDNAGNITTMSDIGTPAARAFRGSLHRLLRAVAAH